MRAWSLLEDQPAANLPARLYHVTSRRNVASIKKNGLVPGGGQHDEPLFGIQHQYEPRIFFATSLDAAYEILMIFEDYQGEASFVFVVVEPAGLPRIRWFLDDQFDHGVWTPDAIPSSAIAEYIEPETDYIPDESYWAGRP